MNEGFARKPACPPTEICWVTELWKSYVRIIMHAVKITSKNNQSHFHHTERLTRSFKQLNSSVETGAPGTEICMSNPHSHCLGTYLNPSYPFRVRTLFCFYLIQAILQKRYFATWLSLLELESLRKVLNGSFSSSSFLCYFLP